MSVHVVSAVKMSRNPLESVRVSVVVFCGCGSTAASDELSEHDKIPGITCPCGTSVGPEGVRHVVTESVRIARCQQQRKAGLQ